MNLQTLLKIKAAWTLFSIILIAYLVNCFWDMMKPVTIIQKTLFLIASMIGGLIVFYVLTTLFSFIILFFAFRKFRKQVKTLLKS